MSTICQMETLFVIFYVDDVYIASRDPGFLQKEIDGLVMTFERVGLETNTKKTQAMTCTPDTIRLQLPTESYRRMRTGCTPAAKWDAHIVIRRECRKEMRASSLGCHLGNLHMIYQQQVVAKSYSTGGRVWSTKSRWGMGHSNVHSPLTGFHPSWTIL